MTPIFPDCYDQWSLMFQTYTLFEGDQWSLMFQTYTLFKGTEEECRQYAHDNFEEDGREALYLMDWEGREWEV